MAAIAQFTANRCNAQKSTSTRSLSMSLGTLADCFMQNKANLLDAQMNVNSVLTKYYENVPLRRRGQNKPNQTQPVVSLPAVSKVEPSNLFPKSQSNDELYARARTFDLAQDNGLND